MVMVAAVHRIATIYEGGPPSAPLQTTGTSEGRLLAAILGNQPELRWELEGAAVTVSIPVHSSRRHTLSTAEFPPSTDRVRELLRKKLREERFSFREVERRLGLGHGTVANLLATGRASLKLHHLDLFASVFGVSSLDLFAEAHGVSLANPLPMALPAHLAEPDQLKDLLREVLSDSDLLPCLRHSAADQRKS
jgi:transcriptional regulator with XRE-family HTH domain